MIPPAGEGQGASPARDHPLARLLAPGFPPEGAFRSLAIETRGAFDAHAVARRAGAGVAGPPDDAGPRRRAYGPETEAGAGGSPGPRTEFTWRCWWDLPARWRDDLAWPNGATTIVLDVDGAAASWVSMTNCWYTDAAPDPAAAPASTEAMSLPRLRDRIAEFPLFARWLAAGEWQWDEGTTTQVAGRPGRRVRLASRAGTGRPGGWLGASAFDAVVDDTTGLLLSLTALAGGTAVGTIAATSFQVDPPLDPALFALRPPPGARVVRVARSG